MRATHSYGAKHIPPVSEIRPLPNSQDKPGVLILILIPCLQILALCELSVLQERQIENLTLRDLAWCWMIVCEWVREDGVGKLEVETHLILGFPVEVLD